jgi:hypothetical protein
MTSPRLTRFTFDRRTKGVHRIVNTAQVCLSLRASQLAGSTH